jgi:DNA segregation ATPase FtsK/SpoIIIE-like protein
MIKRGAVRRCFQELNIQNVSFPSTKRVRKDSAGGFSISLKLHTGADFEELNGYRHKIAVALGSDEVIFEKVGGRLGTMKVLMPLPLSFPSWNPPVWNQMTNRVSQRVAIGLNSAGEEEFLELFSDEGARATLIGGIPGQGKSTLIRLVVGDLADTSTAICWFDAKNGADAKPFEKRVDVYCDLEHPEEFLGAILKLKHISQERNRFLGLGLPIEMLPNVLFILDEWAILSSLGSKTLQNEMNLEVRKLVATARSANVSVILATQRPTKDNIDVTTRELSSNRICFKVGDIHGSEAVLGQSGAESSVNPLKTGRCLFWRNSKLERMILFQQSAELVNRSNEFAGNKLTLDDLIYMNQVFAQEHRV